MKRRQIKQGGQRRKEEGNRRKDLVEDGEVVGGQGKKKQVEGDGGEKRVRRSIKWIRKKI